ncbi:MAG: hypothetical protein IMX02_12485 [Limnochordaceae bacterium]|nr:hypothetical protein [Limnochordaceae bacterium]
MTLLLRILFYVQALMGLSRFGGLLRAGPLWETHVTLGVVIALLALAAFRPREDVPVPGLRAAARFAPLLPLLTGAAILSQSVQGRGFTLLHVLLGILALGLVEMAAAGERKAGAGS